MVVPNEWEIEREKLLSHHHDVTGSVSYTVLVKVDEVLEEINVVLIHIDSPFM